MSDFAIERKIYYHDTDCGGVVYYASYLNHLEEGRSEFCASKEINLKDLANLGTYFVVARVELDYKSPARYQDTIKIITKVEKTGNSSVHFLQKITKDNAVVLESKTLWVCVGKDFKSKSIPSDIKIKF
jgi:acyl-CoA thioester hydrolase